MKIYKVLIIVVLAVSVSIPCLAQKDAAVLLREGLLGAGAGAVGGLASGADGSDVWKGALTGAGINIVGGLLLDSISGERVDKVERVKVMQPQDAYSQAYQEGFNNGYKQGYTQGYKDAMKDSLGQ
ncbi:hypothetical protein ACFL3J_00875 [Candidatus Omnitrophota bacterium]